MCSRVRVRFAPSPTGKLHIGGLRTALYNYIFSKQHGGDFIVRVEDTDDKRTVEGSIEDIFRTLDRCGLREDESMRIGGKAGPYIQSECLPRYQAGAEQLVADGLAYYCFCTEERLQVLHRSAKAAGRVPRYDKLCSFLSPEEVAARRRNGEPHVVRMHIDEEGYVEAKDGVRGLIRTPKRQLSDGILLKSNGVPTYHLANVLDDHHMDISHVIRGEEWLPSLPIHTLLYNYLGYHTPQFYHLPLLVKADGRKLSKRDMDSGAAHLLDVYDLYPPGIVNYLYYLGFTPTSHPNNRVLSMAEMASGFNLNALSTHSAMVDRDKLRYFHIENMIHDIDGALAYYANQLEAYRWCTDSQLVKAIPLSIYQSRYPYDMSLSDALAWLLPNPNPPTLSLPFLTNIEAVKQWEESEIETILVGQKYSEIRAALSREKRGPKLSQLMCVLGKEECLRRFYS